MPDAPQTSEAAAGRGQFTPKQKLLVELGPLMVFFVTYFLAKKLTGGEVDPDDAEAVAKVELRGMIWATGAFVPATLAALLASFRVERRVQPMTLVTAVLVVVLGGLTIYLQDATFIQRKPTLVSGLMGSLMLGGLLFGRSMVQPLMGSSLSLTDEGWRKLTLRWGLFFYVVAAANEVAWRNLSMDAWLNFKVFGILGMTFLFLLLQAPLLQRHALEPESGGDAAGQNDR
jgi:intracellular septation protein